MLRLRGSFDYALREGRMTSCLILSCRAKRSVVETSQPYKLRSSLIETQYTEAITPIVKSIARDLSASVEMTTFTLWCFALGDPSLLSG